MRDQLPAQSFRDLTIWQLAHQFVLDIYKITKDFPHHEMYGLTSQIRRAAISIPANIAVGFKKKGSRDKIRYYNIAQGSLEECRYYLLLINDLHYAETTEISDRIDVISKMIDSYIKRIIKSEK
jgi:four helix bundle protein